MSQTMGVGAALEKERATVVAFTPKQDGWVVLCIRWNDFMPYVVWDARPWIGEDNFRNSGEPSDPDRLVYMNGHYCRTIGAAIQQYAQRGGDVSAPNETINR